MSHRNQRCDLVSSKGRSLERQEVILYEPLSAPLAAFEGKLEHTVLWSALVDDLWVYDARQNLNAIHYPVPQDMT